MDDKQTTTAELPAGGITLRDIYAAAALGGLCANPDRTGSSAHQKVQLAFSLADHALFLRSKEGAA